MLQRHPQFEIGDTDSGLYALRLVDSDPKTLWIAAWIPTMGHPVRSPEVPYNRATGVPQQSPQRWVEPIDTMTLAWIGRVLELPVPVRTDGDRQWFYAEHDGVAVGDLVRAQRADGLCGVEKIFVCLDDFDKLAMNFMLRETTIAGRSNNRVLADRRYRTTRDGIVGLEKRAAFRTLISNENKAVAMAPWASVVG